MSGKLVIRGAREHNLKNIDIELDKDKLIVISGLSGSGKSSLAFDTIFAEGQRRYVESLSSYARMFLGRLEKPDVDYIEGLSPAISIEQKTSHRNPRSTVGTVTEIYDYYRLLWARVGKQHCHLCGREITEQSIDQIISAIMTKKEGTKIIIFAPVAIGRKGEYKKVFQDAVSGGYSKARVDGVIIDDLSSPPALEKQVKHSISILIDRVVVRSESRSRLSDSLEAAIDMTNGLVEVGTLDQDGNIAYEIFSEKNSCPHCGVSMPEMQPRLFSFNSPYGACPECNGLGYTSDFDISKLIPDRTLSFNQGALPTQNPKAPWGRKPFEALAKAYGFSLDTPFCDLSDEIMNVILWGSDESIPVEYTREDSRGSLLLERKFPGVIPDLRRRYRETFSLQIRMWLESFMTEKVCRSCNGNRLRKEAISVTVGGKNIIDATHMSVDESRDFFNRLELTPSQTEISKQVLKEIKARLNFLSDVGLGYLTLSRSAPTLSGGEAQRIRLATQIGSALSGVLYVLDEPSIGLHQRDNGKLISTLKGLRDLGNTVVVVEHDEDTIRSADYVVDLGPGAGVNGGYVIAQGTPKQIEANPDSVTGQFLSGALSIPVPAKRREGNGKFITVKGARKNNLKNIDVSIPLGKLVVFTGVSGSGKSTLLNQTILEAVKNEIFRRGEKPDGYDSISGVENIDKVINIDQSPIGRTPRSNPATYIGVFAPIRDLFASLPESRARSYSPGRFSFNVSGGRCENCKGDGTIKIEMNFLPDVYVTCDVCHGKRFNQETLSIRYKGKNINDVLEMTMDEAREFFKAIPVIKRKLDTVCSVGLGYVKLGQSALTLSGGEAQRVKLALELSKISTGKTLYVLDEPTTGLHFADVKKLMEVLNRLVDSGNTVVLIEHNLDVIKQADYVIDLGPEGGEGGGKIVAEGTPEAVSLSSESYTGCYLKKVLDERR